MRINKIFSSAAWHEGNMWGMWFRIFGYGLFVSTAPQSFSERYGYKKVLRIFGVRFRFLRPDKIDNNFAKRRRNKNYV